MTSGCHRPSSDPSVSILIPAFRATYLDAALASAVGQDWGELEVIVSDDCPDDSVESVVRRWQARHADLVYVRNRPAHGPRRNPIELVRLAQGDLVKFLNDDDVLDARCVRRMASVLRDLDGVSLVTSHRRLIDAEGNELPPIRPTLRPVAEDSIVPGADAIGAVLGSRVNWIGEPSTTMFRRSGVGDPETLFSFAGRPALANADVTLWVRLLTRGDLCYLTESLSSFRHHDEQGQRDPDFLARAHAGWDQIIGDARGLGLATDSTGPLEATPLDERPWWTPDTLEAVLEADRLLEAGDAEGAAHALQRAAVASDDDPSVVVLLASLHTALGSPEVAFGLLAPLLRGAHDRVPVLVAMADAADVMERRDDALALRRQALALAPGDRTLAEAAALSLRRQPVSTTIGCR